MKILIFSQLENNWGNGNYEFALLSFLYNLIIHLFFFGYPITNCNAKRKGRNQQKVTITTIVVNLSSALLEGWLQTNELYRVL